MRKHRCDRSSKGLRSVRKPRRGWRPGAAETMSLDSPPEPRLRDDDGPGGAIFHLVLVTNTQHRLLLNAFKVIERIAPVRSRKTVSATPSKVDRNRSSTFY